MLIEKLYPSLLWIKSFFGNTYGAYVDAVIIALLFALVFFVIDYLLSRKAAVSQAQDDSLLVGILDSIKPPYYFFIAFYIGIKTLVLHPLIDKSIFVILVAWSAWYSMRLFDLFVDHVSQQSLGSGKVGENVTAAISLLSGIVKVGLWVIAGLLVLSNLGVNITSLIAGVGIGGIAIAFAVKGILEDLFSSFSIYFDKPFRVGDMIDVDGEKGTVKKIGIKTTRLKSMTTGEEIVMTNKDLTTKKIHNFRRMTKRRVSVDFGITYETPTAKLKKISSIIEKIVTKQENTEFSRVNLRSYDDSTVRFTLLYHITVRDYEVYLGTHERILFGVREAFEKEGIELGYPTQTLYVKK